jgi:hypothetical protein
MGKAENKMNIDKNAAWKATRSLILGLLMFSFMLMMVTHPTIILISLIILLVLGILGAFWHSEYSFYKRMNKDKS